MEAEGFKGAVGFVDGTTFPLHIKPRYKGASYWGRKGRYSINGQIICDTNYMIRHLLIGMQGSCHDGGVFRHLPWYVVPLNSSVMASTYLLISGYKATLHLVSSYKGNQRDELSNPAEPAQILKLNAYLTQSKVRNEHVIGVLKACFASLRGLRLDIWKPEDIQNVVTHVIACVVLHNIANEEDPWTDSGSSSSSVESSLSSSSEDGGPRRRGPEDELLVKGKGCKSENDIWLMQTHMAHEILGFPDLSQKQFTFVLYL